MQFHSILFTDLNTTIRHEAPEFFHDLNLDQIVAAVTAGRQDYDLAPFFYTSLHDLDAIAYRQEVMRDLENEHVIQSIHAFSRSMRAMREHLEQAKKFHYKYEKERWFLGAAERYCAAVIGLSHDLNAQALKSRGMTAFRDYLLAYAQSANFTQLAAEMRALTSELSAIRYCVLIDGDAVTVSRFEDEADTTEAVEEIFRKFRRGAVKDYRAEFKSRATASKVVYFQ